MILIIIYFSALAFFLGGATGYWFGWLNGRSQALRYCNIYVKRFLERGQDAA